MNLIMGILTAAMLLAFASVAVWDYRHVRNGEWRTYSGNRMRRWVNGEWQVREAAPDENDDHIHNFSM